jgi:hypothetical protein
MTRTQRAAAIAGSLLLTLTPLYGEAQSPAAGFSLKYVQSGQDAAQIAIAGLRLRRSATQCPDERVAQNCSNATTQSAEVSLKSEDVHKLQATIKSSGFLQLKDVYGNTAQGALSYPRSITVRSGNVTKSVEYRGGPGTEPAPSAFTAVEKAITALAAKANLPAS